MSIIGEMYEEENWKFNEDLKLRMEEFLAYLGEKMEERDDHFFVLWNTAELFKETFKTELKGNEV